MNKKEIIKEKERIKSLFGLNQELTSDIDPEHSIKCFNGTFVPRVNGDVSVFRGIPFALPPIGERRWKRATPVSHSDKIFEAYYNGYTPIQTVIDSERSSYYPQSEDCLYLNVWVNNSSTKKDKPIMVFIHGGSYGWGGTVDPLYDGLNFISFHPDVILITIGYRVGMFGFIDLSSIPGGEEYGDAPNLGLYDQIEALKWIKQNGKAFGGDINNVTIFGESAGGGSVSLLPLIKEARGLFKRVIAESGSVALTYSIEDCQPLTKKLVELTGIKSVEELIALPIEKLIEVNQTLNNINNFPMRDGKLIPLDPYEAYLDKEVKDIDFLFGTNANEMNYWIGELGGLFAYSYGMPLKFKHDVNKLSEEEKKNVDIFMKELKDNKINKISEFYNETMFRLPAILQAEKHHKNGGHVYMYYWKEKSSIPFFKACHAVELAYVFNNIDETIYTGKQGDMNLSLTISHMWVNFATMGNPSFKDVVWEEFDTKDRKTLFVKKDKLEMVSDPLSRQRELLMPLMKTMINPGYGDISLSLPFFSMIKQIISALFNTIVLKATEKA